MKGRPWMQFYTADWRADVKLRLCSLAARGLWVDMLALMHDEGEPYGHLRIQERAIGADDLAVLVGRPAREVRAALAELERNGVPSINDDGYYQSRRMIRDEEVRQRRAAGGYEGGPSRWSQGNLKGHLEGNLKSKSKVASLSRARAQARSDSDSDSGREGEVGGGVEGGGDFERFWAAYPRKVGKGDARKAWAQVRAGRPPIDELLAALGRLIASDQWRDDGGRWVPYPATWLRREGWEDQPDGKRSSPGASAIQPELSEESRAKMRAIGTRVRVGEDT